MMKLYVVPITSQLDEVTIKLVCASSATEMRFGKDILDQSQVLGLITESPWTKIQMFVFNN